MAAAKFLKISSTGIPTENATTDDLTVGSVAITSGPTVSSTGIAMADKDITGLNLITFTNATTDGITQTAGLLIIDNVMAKERSNALTTAADILFPTISDSAGQVDAFRLPVLAGTPTATPTNSSEGYLVWNSTSNKIYAWDGAAWTNDIAASASSAAAAIDTTNYVADTVGVSARDVVYISAAGKVSPADANVEVSSQAIGFATAAALATVAVSVQMDGVLSGFSGLTAGAAYFLSETAGGITTTPPTTSGAQVLLVGYATSTTKLHILFQKMGTRA